MDVNTFAQNYFFTEDQKMFFLAYIEAVYFTDTGDIDQPESYAELTERFLHEAARDCVQFYNVYRDFIGKNLTQAGHDFWLTKNGHGAGFWDRPEIWGDRADELTRACELMGEHYSEFDEV